MRLMENFMGHKYLFDFPLQVLIGTFFRSNKYVQDFRRLYIDLYIKCTIFLSDFSEY
jgi:hypothetical protein